MKILIKSAKIINKGSSFDGKVVNVLLDKGKIADIGKEEFKADKIIEAKGQILTAGWFDMRSFMADPGFEHKEDLFSGTETAAFGGFTGVAVLPNTNPVTQTKNDISYIKSRANGSITDVYPIAAVTLDAKGVGLTEMIDLHHAGAIAFSDGLKPIWHTDIVLKALQYLQKFDGLLINRPEDIHLNMYGVMNEGVSSTMLGMKGMPKLGEELVVQRDLEILAYTGGRLHFANISSGKSLTLIKAAKKKGLNVTCDIASFQTSFTDDDLSDFDTNFKVNPPLRESKTNKAITKALAEGIIDVIVSSHIPQDEESKKLEFDLADFGIISLQTVASNISALSAEVPMELLIESITTRPRTILKLEVPIIEKGAKANITLFDPGKEWTLDSKTSKSKSRNSPFWGKKLTGAVTFVANNGKVLIND